MAESNPKDEQPTGTPAEPGDKEKEAMVNLKTMPLPEILRKLQELRGKEKFPWKGSKETATLSVENLIRLGCGDDTLGRQAEVLKEQEANLKAIIAKGVAEGVEPKAIELLQNMGISKKELGLEGETDATPKKEKEEQPKGTLEKDKEGTPEKPFTKGELEQLVAKKFSELSTPLQEKLLEKVGGAKKTQETLERLEKSTTALWETMDKAKIAQLREEHPFLRTHIAEGKREADDPIAFSRFLYLIDRTKMTPDEAAAQVAKEVKERDTALVQKEIDAQLKKGDLAPPSPGKEAPRVDEDWDGEGGVRALFDRKRREGESDQIAPAPGPWNPPKP